MVIHLFKNVVNNNNNMMLCDGGGVDQRRDKNRIVMLLCLSGVMLIGRDEVKQIENR
jgi:hypothetical protein